MQHKAWIDKVRKEQGLAVSSTASEVTLRQDLLWVWNAFCDLNRVRGTVFTGHVVVHEPITYTDIKNYLDIKCIEDSRSKILLSRFITSMDKVYINDHLEKLKIESEKAKKANASRR